MPEPKRCELCGELMPCPVPRDHGPNQWVCADCYGDTDRLMGGPRESGERADRQYHGGLGNRGEW